MKAISLRSVVDELEILPEEAVICVDRQSGDLVHVRNEVLEAVQVDPGAGPVLSWETQDEYDVARAIQDGGERFVALPSRFDINEWDIMRMFAESLDDDLSAELSDAIHGRGAFRMFKSAVRQHGIEEEWANFRSRALSEIAVTWLGENSIPFVDDLPGGFAQQD